MEEIFDEDCNDWDEAEFLALGYAEWHVEEFGYVSEEDLVEYLIENGVNVELAEEVAEVVMELVEKRRKDIRCGKSGKKKRKNMSDKQFRIADYMKMK